ncbi:hypothetical protein ACHQM5_026527 [Ranunculus cassubicifolius]
MEDLTEDERRALRKSKFAPLPPPPPTSRPIPRLAHPGGPLATNKAAALAKFLERKLQEPGGLSSMNPALVEQAVKNAKETVNASTSSSGRVIRHVASFGDPELPDSEEEDGGNKPNRVKESKPKKFKKKKNNKKVPSLT